MIEKIKYINHMNEVIEFGKEGVFVNANDLHDFAWSINSKNDKISSFKKGITKKSLPVVIKCETDDECNAAKNRLFEVCEKDVVAVKHGRLVIGDYYLKCYVTETKVTEYLLDDKYVKITLNIHTDYPQWVKDTTYTFGVINVHGTDLDYNNDFPYDYTTNILNARLNNNDFVSTNFRMKIFGSAVNPKVTVGGQEYQVNVNVESNEYITIDSIAKTIELTKSNGVVQNCFNLRNRDSYIFEKIPPGTSNIALSGDFNVEITLLEERGVPKWI